MSDVIYCIPLSRWDAYRGHRVVVRAPNAATLIRNLPSDDLGRLAYARLPCSADDLDLLRKWGPPVPVDLIMSDPAERFPSLYRWTALRDTRPVRVSMPTVPGFSKAARLAATLGFEVKLELRQPAEVQVTEILGLLEFYLHSPSASQPIEPFHGLLSAFCQAAPASIWGIQEQDPADTCDVLDDGTEVLPGCLGETVWSGEAAGAVDEFEQALLSSGAECGSCEFRPVCRGYFKAPLRDYACDYVKSLLGSLKRAAAELKRDVEACRRASPGDLS